MPDADGGWATLARAAILVLTAGRLGGGVIAGRTEGDPLPDAEAGSAGASGGGEEAFNVDGLVGGGGGRFSPGSTGCCGGATADCGWPGCSGTSDTAGCPTSTSGAANTTATAWLAGRSGAGRACTIAGDLLFNGIAQQASRQNVATGAQADASWRINDTHTLRAGFLAQTERVTADTTSTVLPLAANGTQTSTQPFNIADSLHRTGSLYGVYLQDEWRLLPALTLNYGLRADAVEQFTQESQLSPRINLVWKPLTDTTLHIGYARYFAPPPFEAVTPATITKFLGTTAAPSVTQDTAVRAERSNYFDAGISQLILPGLTVGIDAFFKQSKNLIDEGQFGAPIILTAFNYATGMQTGVQLTGSYDQGPVSVYANVASSRAVGRTINSAQFNFAPDELAYIQNNYIHLDHDQAWSGSAGAAYTFNPDSTTPTRLSADLLVQSGLRANTATVPILQRCRTASRCPPTPPSICRLSNAFDQGLSFGWMC